MHRRNALLSLAGLACGMRLSAAAADRATVTQSFRYQSQIDALRHAAADMQQLAGRSAECSDAGRLCHEVIRRIDRRIPVSAALAQSTADSCRRAVRSCPAFARTDHHHDAASRLQQASNRYIQSVTQRGTLS